MLDKDKIVKAEIVDMKGRTIISTQTLEFPKDFFSFKAQDFVVFKGTNIIPINMGEKVDAIFYYRNGDRIKYETEIDLATDLQVNIHLGNTCTTLEERRRYFKTQTDIYGDISYYITEEETIPFEKNLSVHILNINLGGIFMRTSFEFKVGDKFMISLLCGKVQTITEVLRIQDRDSSNQLGYGCKFSPLSPVHEQALSKFIFECQLAEREKKKYSQ